MGKTELAIFITSLIFAIVSLAFAGYVYNDTKINKEIAKKFKPNTDASTKGSIPIKIDIADLIKTDANFTEFFKSALTTAVGDGKGFFRRNEGNYNFRNFIKYGPTVTSATDPSLFIRNGKFYENSQQKSYDYTYQTDPTNDPDSRDHPNPNLLNNPHSDYAQDILNFWELNEKNPITLYKWEKAGHASDNYSSTASDTTTASYPQPLDSVEWQTLIDEKDPNGFSSDPIDPLYYFFNSAGTSTTGDSDVANKEQKAGQYGFDYFKRLLDIVPYDTSTGDTTEYTISSGDSAVIGTYGDTAVGSLWDNHGGCGWGHGTAEVIFWPINRDNDHGRNGDHAGIGGCFNDGSKIKKFIPV